MSARASKLVALLGIVLLTYSLAPLAPAIADNHMCKPVGEEGARPLPGNLSTDKPQETERFYTDVLGFRLKARDRVTPPGAALNLTHLELGGTVVELITYEGAAVDPAPRNEHLGYRMIALEVDDMQKTADYLRTKGVDIVWGPRVRETYSRAEICDPNGFHIELRQWFR